MSITVGSIQTTLIKLKLQNIDVLMFVVREENRSLRLSIPNGIGVGDDVYVFEEVINGMDGCGLLVLNVTS